MYCVNAALYFIVVSTIFPLGDALIVADEDGKVYELNLHCATDDNHFLCQQLPGCHQPNTTLHFFSLHGKMSPQGLLSSIGEYPSEEEEGNPLYVNLFNVGSPSSIPCVVLLGLGAGYSSSLRAEKITNPSLYFTTWAFTNVSSNS